MRGVILAGGTGSRLGELTKVMNKHLLPVYNKPMIYYPLQSMAKSGIEEVLLVCGGNAAGEFLRVLGNGKQFGLKTLHYTYQQEAGGIAQALGLAEDFADGQPICVMLGDNVLENNFAKEVDEFKQRPFGARIFLVNSERPEWYGVVETDDAGNILSIEEKPKAPKSNQIAIGLYFYDTAVFHWIKELKPSGRGELEITDLNKHYWQNPAPYNLRAHTLEGWWLDCGESFDTYLHAQNKVKELSL